LKITDYIWDNLNKAIVFSLLYISAWVLLQVTLRIGYQIGLFFSILPFLLFAFIFLLEKPYFSFLLLFVANYFISGGTRYISYPPGIAMDVLFLVALVVLVLQSYKLGTSFPIKGAANPLTAISFLWLLYCTFQILNPDSSSIFAWLVNVRGIGIYFFLVVLLSTVYLRKYRNLRQVMNILSVLCIIAVSKAIIQKVFGFDSFEQTWLAEGGSRTHIIHTGIRYFSIFTDAGNFGSGIALSGVLFSISAFSQKNTAYRNYYLFVSTLCFYGMIISGTRGSLIIPFGGFFLYAILSKNIRAIIVTFIVVVSGFWFLNFTYIGHGNIYVRRMRSAFNPDDESLGVRLENQRILRTYMQGKPFGVGIGMKRGNAVLYQPHPILSTIPHDSWYVLLWVELGLVGMVLYILMLLYVLFHGSYLVMFVLKDKELRGYVSAMVCALFGVSAAAYSLEIFGQFPNSVIIYVLMSLIFLSPLYDEELSTKSV
jgi:hypothetical protein